MAAVRTLCTRAILLKEGRVQAIGETGSVITQYLSSCSDEMRTAIELPLLEGSEARASELRLATFDGKPQSQFLIGEPWKLHLEFELNRDTTHVIAAVGLRNIEGMPLITWWSAPADLRAGRYAVEFHCHFPFSAGELNFVIGISSNERPIYYVEGVGAVTICEIAQGEQPLRASDTGILVSSERPEIFLRP